MRLRLSRLWACLKSSGPLLTSGCISIAGLVIPASFYGPGHVALFDILTKEQWSILSGAATITGYLGFLLAKHSLWRAGHSVAVFLCIVMGVLFAYNIMVTGSGAPYFVCAMIGLGLNSWDRSTGNYIDPFVKKEECNTQKKSQLRSLKKNRDSLLS